MSSSSSSHPPASFSTSLSPSPSHPSSHSHPPSSSPSPSFSISSTDWKRYANFLSNSILFAATAYSVWTAWRTSKYGKKCLGKLNDNGVKGEKLSDVRSNPHYHDDNDEERKHRADWHNSISQFTIPRMTADDFTVPPSLLLSSPSLLSLHLSTPFGLPARQSLFDLRDNTLFLNHGSYGVCPSIVQKYQHFIQQIVENHTDLFMRVMAHKMERMVMEEIFSPESMESSPSSPSISLHPFALSLKPSQAIFITNTTAAVNTVINSISFTPNDIILTSNLTYRACNHILHHVTHRFGTTYMEFYIDLPVISKSSLLKNFQIQMTEILINQCQKKGKTVRFVLLDVITSPHAAILPYAEMAKIVKECFGPSCFVMLDGAHSPGQHHVDLLHVPQVDFFAGNLHKWCYGPKGSAILYVNDNVWNSSANVSHTKRMGGNGYGNLTPQQLQEQKSLSSPSPTSSLPINLQGLIISHAYYDSSLHNRFLSQATRDVSSFISASESYHFIRTIGVERMRNYISTLLDSAVNIFENILGVKKYYLFGKDMECAYMRTLQLPVEIPEEYLVGDHEVKSGDANGNQWEYHYNVMCDGLISEYPINNTRRIDHYAHVIMYEWFTQYDLVLPVFAYKNKLFVRLSGNIYNELGEYEKAAKIVKEWCDKTNQKLKK